MSFFLAEQSMDVPFAAIPPPGIIARARHTISQVERDPSARPAAPDLKEVLPPYPAAATGVPAASSPGWWMCLACLALPWLNPFAHGPSSSVDPWLASAVFLAIAFALGRSESPHRALLISLAALAGWAVVRTGVGADTVALAAACGLIAMAAGFAGAALAHSHWVRVIAVAWFAAAALSTLIALAQYFGASETFAPWFNIASAGEAFANLRQRNQFASLTMIGMASLFWLRAAGWGRWPVVLAVCWLAIGNAATTSRTGLTELLLLGVLAAIWPGERRERALLWVAALAAYLIAALALPALLDATTGVTGNRLWDRVVATDACSSRRALWSNVLHLIAQKPWLGWGWGELDFGHYTTLYAQPRFCDILDNAHNLPLHLAVELGVPAALLICGGVFAAMLRAKPLQEVDATRQMAWTVLMVLAVHSLLEYPLWYGPFQIALGLCLGLLAPARAPGTGADASAAPAGLARVAIAACAVAACLYGAWDYRRVSQIYLPVEARAPGMRDPLPEIRRSWLFRSQALFAELTITPLTAANSQWTFDTAIALLHYSPEPRVVEKVIESAVMLHRDDAALEHLARFRAAFPAEYDEWSKDQARTLRALGKGQGSPAR
jgi:O-antigen ligase